MKTVALTGSIGSGKTTVLKTVCSLRIPTVDCDSLVQKLYRSSTIKKKLIKEFGIASKAELAQIAFSSKAKRKKLEKIFHPLVWKLVNQKLTLFKKQKKALAFVDVPLLFEAGWQKRFDTTVFVKATKKQCLLRLKKRGLSGKEALLRWNAQMPQKKKIKSAHHVIDNTGPKTKTRTQTKKIAKELLNG